MSKKVGILGGSFDPIHFGHLHLALSLQEQCGLDEVLFVPAGLSPFKEKTHAPPEHRLQMLKLAIAPLPRFRILDWELRLKGPTYTIDTVRRLSQDSSPAQLHLLLSDDVAATLPLWKEAEELVRLAPPLIASRAGAKTPQPTQGEIVRIPAFEISSTLIRERLHKQLYCGHLLPASVLDYIHQHALYSKHDL